MRVITGDECGIIKECIPELDENNAVRRVNDGETVARKHGCVDLCWVGEQPDESFASLSLGSVCSVWERTNGDNADDDGTTKSFGKYRRRSQIVNIFEETNNNKPAALHPSTNPLGLFAVEAIRLCACNAAGKVSIIDTSNERVVQTFDSIKLTDQDDTQKALLTSCAASTAQEQHAVRLAVGGQERDITLWDLATGKEAWKAKNARPDPQTLLQQQVWPTSIAFIGDNILAVGSAHKELRLYDIRQQRRPIALTPKGMWEHRVTALRPLPNDKNTLVIGDSAGYLQSMDVRNLKQITGRYVGPAGSIRAIMAHSREARLAVVGLDRMLRIYDSSSRKQLHCMYLRQRLNSVLFGQAPSHVHTGQDASTDAAVSTQDDSNWDQDDQVEDYVDSDNDDDEAPKLKEDEDMDENVSQSESEDGEDSGSDDKDDSESRTEASDSGDESESDDEEEDDGDEKRKPSKRMKT